MLYAVMGLAFVLPQKMIGDQNWGIFVTAQAILTTIFMLSDGLALQSMVTFGMEKHRRAEATTISAIVHVAFIGVCTAIVYLCRHLLAGFFGEPQLAGTLELFPLVALGFLLRNFFLKVAQLDIDMRRMFFIDAAWVAATSLLLLVGWTRRTLVTADDMMYVTARSASVSSLVGLILSARHLRATLRVERDTLRQAMRFGVAQCAAAATLAAQTQGDVLLLDRFATAATVGNYDVAKKFFRGFEALRDAAAMFVYPAVARLRAQSRMTEMVLMVEKMIGFTLVVVVPLVALVWVLPIERLFGFLYKSQYEQVPQIFRLLSLAALGIPFVLNLNVLNGLGDARAGFRTTLISSAVFFATALLLVPPLGADGAALAIVASFFALGIGSTLAVRRHVRFSLVGALGRWRDAFAYGLRFWKKRAR